MLLLPINNAFICKMLPIYFDYEETSKEYVYDETSVQYRMSYQMMLKFKKYLRNQTDRPTSPAMKNWFLTLSEKELLEVRIIDKSITQQSKTENAFPYHVR